MAMKSQEIKLDSRKTLSYIILMYNVFSDGDEKFDFSRDFSDYYKQDIF